MSWKYSIPYTARDSISSCDSSQNKYKNFKRDGCLTDRRGGLSLGFLGESKSTDHSPLWARTAIKDSPATVQKLKERYNVKINEESSLKWKKKENLGEVPSSLSPRKNYDRSYTTLGIDDVRRDGAKNFSKLRMKSDNSIEFESDRLNSFGSRFSTNLKPYLPSVAKKFSTRNYSSDLNSTIANIYSEEKYIKQRQDDSDDKFTTLVTRGTSPKPSVSTVYLRSKRPDCGIEKKVLKSKDKVDVAHKETQTDKNISPSRYVSLCDTSPTKPSWSSYADKYSPTNSHSPKFPLRIVCGTESRRSTLNSISTLISGQNQEISGEQINSDADQKSSFSKISPIVKNSTSIMAKETSDNKNFRKKSPSKSLSLICNTNHEKNKSNEISDQKNFHTSSPLQLNTMPQSPSNHIGNQSPRMVINHCSDIIQAINEVSSASESSEEESTSEDETNKSVPANMTVKKSITNFLQNIHNGPLPSITKNQIVNNFSSQKINLAHISSNEKPWWGEKSERSSESPMKVKSPRMMSNHSCDYPEQISPTSKNFLSPMYVRNLSNDNHSPHEDSINEHNNMYLYPGSVNSVSVEKGNLVKLSSQVLTGDSSREPFIKDITQKLQNNLGSPQEQIEHGGLTGLILKTKADLKAKLSTRNSCSPETSPKITSSRSEINLYWKELSDSVNRPLQLCDLDFTDLKSDDETDILEGFKMNGEVPPPPPMLMLPTVGQAKGLPSFDKFSTDGLKTLAPTSKSETLKSKKTVKLFWKEIKDETATLKPKINNAALNTLIWDELMPVKIDTQKLEHLFESRAKDITSKKQQDLNKYKEVIVLDPKRSNAINIGITKLPPPRAIKAAILKMDSTVISKEGIEKVLSMLPTEEEKIRIQEAQLANPDIPLGSAEQFLTTLASISQLEARLRLWAFKLNFENYEKEICEPLMDLKQGMEILRENKTFRSILSTLLSIGNFLNGYDVKGFQIEYLSKVPEVKDTVHKHSLLHHLCIIVMEKFPESSDLYSEIGAVTRASKVDFDELAANLKKLEDECKLSWNYLKQIAKYEGHTTMKAKMSDFLADCAERIIILEKVQKRIRNRFQKFSLWLGIPINQIASAKPHEIFKFISEFALEFRTTRDRVLQQIKKINREKSRTRGHVSPETNAMLGRKMNSKEAKDDAKLKQLLGGNSTLDNTPTWRRQRKDAKNTFQQEINNNDEEILETLIKTANQISSPRTGLKERRRKML